MLRFVEWFQALLIFESMLMWVAPLQVDWFSSSLSWRVYMLVRNLGMHICLQCVCPQLFTQHCLISVVIHFQLHPDEHFCAHHFLLVKLSKKVNTVVASYSNFNRWVEYWTNCQFSPCFIPSDINLLFISNQKYVQRYLPCTLLLQCVHSDDYPWIIAAVFK